MRRRYTIEEKGQALAVLDAERGRVKTAARKLGMPRKTLSAWQAGRVPPEVHQMHDQARADLADRLEELAHELLTAAAEKIGAANLLAVMTSLGIVVDKMQILRGKATSIAGHVLTDEVRAERIEAVLAAARARLPAKVIHADHYATVAEALDARDRALDAGHAHVRVDGLPEIIEGSADVDGDPLGILPEDEACLVGQHSTR